MRKIVLVAAVALLVGFVSCTSKHDCKCTIIQSFDGEEVGHSEMTYPDMKEDCSTLNINQNASADGSTMTQTMTCKQI